MPVETADRRRLKLLNIVDDHTLEALAMRVGRSCDADTVVSAIERPVAERGALQAATGPNSLGRLGRAMRPTLHAAVVRFNRAFAAHHLYTLGENLTDDCRFVDTTSPDGVAYHGRHAVLGAFGKLFSTNPSASFETEGGLVCGDRVVLQ